MVTTIVFNKYKHVNVIAPLTDITIRHVIEDVVKCAVVYMRWTDIHTLHYVCSGTCEFGHKLISGNVTIVTNDTSPQMDLF
jgi:hypothetical protein